MKIDIRDALVTPFIMFGQMTDFQHGKPPFFLNVRLNLLYYAASQAIGNARGFFNNIT
jgi:hypothetical protein